MTNLAISKEYNCITVMAIVKHEQINLLPYHLRVMQNKSQSLGYENYPVLKQSSNGVFCISKSILAVNGHLCQVHACKYPMFTRTSRVTHYYMIHYPRKLLVEFQIYILGTEEPYEFFVIPTTEIKNNRRRFIYIPVPIKYKSRSPWSKYREAWYLLND